MAAYGGFGGQHNRVCTLVYGGGYVRSFGAGRGRGVDHAFQHMGGNDDRLAERPGHANDFALDDGDLFQRQFNPQITPCHHCGICQF